MSTVVHETNPLKRLRARIAARELGRCTNKRKIEDLLNDDELQDPDLVAFWGIEDEASHGYDQGEPD